MSNNTTTIEILPTELLKVLSAVHVHTSKPKDRLAVLENLHVFISEGRLIVEATDRFRLARAAAKIENVVAEDVPETLLPVEVVKNMIRDLKVAVKEYSELAIVLSWTGPGADFERVTMERFGVTRFGAEIMSHTDVGQYPKLGKLIAGAFDFAPGDPGAEFAVNPEFLTEFWKGIKAGLSARERNGADLRFYAPATHKPVAVAYGDWFAGMVMPIRLAQSDPAEERNLPLKTIAELEPGASAPAAVESEAVAA